MAERVSVSGFDVSTKSKLRWVGGDGTDGWALLSGSSSCPRMVNWHPRSDQSKCFLTH